MIPEWLQTSLTSRPELPMTLLAWRIGAALLLGGAVGAIYRWSRRGEPISATFVPTLVLLAGVIAMATQVIGDNVARAFSLVGALSVVRFRTVVKDTQDTAFVILAVVVGMAAGANHLDVALVGLGLATLAGLVLWPPGRATGWHAVTSTLRVRVALTGGGQEAVETALAAVAPRFELIEVETARQGASLDLSYRIRLRSDATPLGLVAELKRAEGVETVDLSRAEG
jgi:hypothetical protein